MARIQLPPTLVEAIAGAMGEVSQIIALYPLDTIKVSWQAARPSSQSGTGVARCTRIGVESNRALELECWHVEQASVLVRHFVQVM